MTQYRNNVNEMLIVKEVMENKKVIQFSSGSFAFYNNDFNCIEIWQDILHHKKISTNAVDLLNHVKEESKDEYFGYYFTEKNPLFNRKEWCETYVVGGIMSIDY